MRLVYPGPARRSGRGGAKLRFELLWPQIYEVVWVASGMSKKERSLRLLLDADRTIEVGEDFGTGADH